jgi:hypothetical protein
VSVPKILGTDGYVADRGSTFPDRFALG